MPIGKPLWITNFWRRFVPKPRYTDIQKDSSSLDQYPAMIPSRFQLQRFEWEKQWDTVHDSDVRLREPAEERVLTSVQSTSSEPRTLKARMRSGMYYCVNSMDRKSSHNPDRAPTLASDHFTCTFPIGLLHHLPFAYCLPGTSLEAKLQSWWNTLCLQRQRTGK